MSSSGYGLHKATWSPFKPEVWESAYSTSFLNVLKELGVELMKPGSPTSQGNMVSM
jgi:hypothetical protein